MLLSVCLHTLVPSQEHIENRLERRDLWLSARFRCTCIFLSASTVTEWLAGLYSHISILGRWGRQSSYQLAHLDVINLSNRHWLLTLLDSSEEAVSGCCLKREPLL